MAATLSSIKPNLDARLARKREAARMRQQRCRARKRQAVVTKRRQHEGPAMQMSLVQEESRPEASTERPKPSPFREAPIHSSPSRDPIFKIVSFDSPQSPQNDESIFVTPERAALQVISRTCSVESSLSSASHDKQFDISSINHPEQESLVEEEEAAVAAMLSLKSSPSKTVTPPTAREDTTEKSHPAPVKTPSRDPTYVYYGEWDRYHNPYSYGRYGHYPPVPYYAIPPRVSATNYRYPPYGTSYSRYR